MRITHLIREFLSSSTAVLTASVVAATVSQNAIAAKRAQISTPLNSSNLGYKTVVKKSEDHDFVAEIPFDTLFKAGLDIPDKDMLLIDKIAFAHGGYDAMRLWTADDALALNALNDQERHEYFSRLLNESLIGHTLQKIIWDEDGTLHNFVKRFKRPHAVYESLHVRPNAPKSTAELTDLIRYSAIFPLQKYTDSTFKVLNELRKIGFTTTSIWNAWSDKRYPYNAINAVLESPKQGLFELQFHTPLGALINDSTHKLYEKRRLYPKGSEQYENLLAIQKEMVAKIAIPPNVFDIATFNHGTSKNQKISA